MICVILAAGYATRLYPLTENQPKCLLTVGSQTILDILCTKLAALESLTEIVIITNDKFYDQLERWRQRSEHKIAIRVLNDMTRSNDTRLGAIGDFALAMQKACIDSDVLLLASDNLFEGGFEAFVEQASKRPEAITIAVHDLKNPALAAHKYGVLEMNASSEITGLEEKPAHPKTSLIGMGVYYFPKIVLAQVPVYLRQKEAKDAPGYFIGWMLARSKIFGFQFEGLWYDIGDLKSLNEANQTFRG